MTKTRTFEGQVYTYSHTAHGMHYWHNATTGNVWVTKAK